MFVLVLTASEVTALEAVSVDQACHLHVDTQRVFEQLAPLAESLLK